MCIQTAFCSFCVRRISMEIKNYISEILCFPDYETTSSVAPRWFSVKDLLKQIRDAFDLFLMKEIKIKLVSD